jgi:hypothetical protein
VKRDEIRVGKEAVVVRRGHRIGRRRRDGP